MREHETCPPRASASRSAEPHGHSGAPLPVRAGVMLLSLGAASEGSLGRPSGLLVDGPPPLPIELWGGCNIHDDTFLDRIKSQPGRLAICGIHLCKTLSAACIGFFNVLGPQKAPFLRRKRMKAFHSGT